MSKMIIVWILDAGVEPFLAVSLISLRRNAPECWRQSLKIIIDCGLSDSFREFLYSLQSEGVCVVQGYDVEQKHPFPGVDAQRRRIDLPDFITLLDDIAAHDRVLVCDPDTVFLDELQEFPFPNNTVDLAVMPGYTIHRGNEIPTPWLRPATLRHANLDATDFSYIAEQLGLSTVELQNIKSYNTGVIGFLVGNTFDVPWREAYKELHAVTDRAGHPAFAPFMVEQNALSLCIHRRQVYAEDLPRRFNFFPPISPLSNIVPFDTLILHFVYFRGNYRDRAYRRWFDMREQLIASGFLPSTISLPSCL